MIITSYTITYNQCMRLVRDQSIAYTLQYIITYWSLIVPWIQKPPSQTTSTIGFPTSARIRIVIAVCPPIVVAHTPPASSIHLSSHLSGTLTFNLSVP